MNTGRSAKIIFIVAIAALLSYVITFRPENWAGIWFSKDPATWGQFGDFMGGILNPIVAFGAFLWLVESVRIQKSELADTRRALQESQRAQQQQADTSLLTARIQALNVELSSITSRAEHHRAMQRYIVELQNRADNPKNFQDEFGNVLDLRDAREIAAAVLFSLHEDEDKLLEEMKQLSEKFWQSIESSPLN